MMVKVMLLLEECKQKKRGEGEESDPLLLRDSGADQSGAGCRVEEIRSQRPISTSAATVTANEPQNSFLVR